MKRILEILIIIAVIASVGALTGCDPESNSDDQPTAELTPEDRAEFEAELKRERTMCDAAENRAEEADSARSRWAGVSFLLTVAAVATFVAGTAIGSKARHHAES